MTPLPGSLPGLLRRGSPVSVRGCPMVVLDTCDECVVVVNDDSGRPRIYEEELEDVVLDTSDPTGAFHARLWAGTDPERLKVIREAEVEVPEQDFEKAIREATGTDDGRELAFVVETARLTREREAALTRSLLNATRPPDHGGWRKEPYKGNLKHADCVYVHASGWTVKCLSTVSSLWRPDGARETYRGQRMQQVTRHGFTVRADVAELMDYADGMIGGGK